MHRIKMNEKQTALAVQNKHGYTMIAVYNHDFKSLRISEEYNLYSESVKKAFPEHTTFKAYGENRMLTKVSRK